jgi:hypothetical protein
MKKNFLKIQRCKCPYCGKSQTAFIYAFDENLKEVELDKGLSPVGCDRGFTCVVKECQEKVIGDKWYQSVDLTVGDVKPNS